MRHSDRFGSFVVLAVVAAVGTLFAAWSYPMWDDAYLDLMALDQGTAAYVESAADRPVGAAACAWLAEEPSQFYLRASVVHWMVCMGMGLFTLHIARQLFPGRPTLSLATACLATTTFLCRTQIVLAVHPNTPGLSTVTSFLAIFLLAGTIERQLPTWSLSLRWLAASALLGIAGILSEYFVASTLAGAAWIAFLGWGLETQARRRAYRSGLALVVLTVGIYLAYHQIASAAARPEVRPELFLTESIGWRGKVTFPVWASCIYTGSMGAMFDRLGSLTLLRFGDAAALGAGVLLAILVQLFAGRPKRELDSSDANVFEQRLLIGLFIALAVGLLPMVAMGRRPDLTTFSSRFWAPIVPFALCTSVGLLASLLKSKRLWLLSPLCALLAGWAQVSDGLETSRELRRVSSWGPEVRKQLSENGMCVAIFENAWQAGQPVPNDYELVARLARTWPREERERFWAFPDFYWTRRKDASSGIEIDHELHAPKIHRTTRFLAREGPISRVLWVYVTPEGELQFSPVDVAEEAK
jgi:hypothetical protein